MATRIARVHLNISTLTQGALCKATKMGYDGQSGSSTTTEMKAPYEQFEYDDRNHSIAPSTRKLSTSAADLMRRNASGEYSNTVSTDAPIDEEQRNWRILLQASVMPSWKRRAPNMRLSTTLETRRISGLSERALFLRKTLEDSHRSKVLPVWSWMYFRRSSTTDGLNQSSCILSSYCVRLALLYKEWVSRSKALAQTCLQLTDEQTRLL